jgi:hypothetical protein
MADFFTAKMLNTKSINNMLDRVFYGANKSSFMNRKKYHFNDNNDKFNQNSLIFNLLWDIDKKLPAVSEALILEALPHLSPEPHIAKNLLNALIKSCQNHCQNTFDDQLKLYKIFESNGF